MTEIYRLIILGIILIWFIILVIVINKSFNKILKNVKEKDQLEKKNGIYGNSSKQAFKRRSY